LKNPEEWRERLATVRRWIEWMTSDEEEETGPSYEDVLEERIRLAGYANFVDDRLIEKSPIVLVRRIEAAEVRSVSLPEETLTITAENISTQPRLVPEPPRVSVRSSSGNLVASLAVDPAR